MRPAPAFVAFSLLAGPAFAADPVEGDWVVESLTRVRVAPCAGHADRMCGHITGLRNPSDEPLWQSRDISNPDPRLRSRTIVGLPFVRDLRRVARGRWKGGKIYDPSSGRTYGAEMEIAADGTLRVGYCLLIFCDPQSWQRAP
jgi:uncharacterized protein (DUF2147 family)